ncbi:MAG: RNA-splicing factor [Sporothrix thermara]
MSDNVGLSTPRGSGTSGYVQRNRAFIRPRDNAYGGPHGNSNPRDLLASQQASRLRQPDQGILEHDRKRAIEVRVFALRDELEEKGDIDEDAIDERCDALRKQLTDEAQRGGGRNGTGAGGGDVRQRYKAHQVHEQARAKIVESERLRRALRINKDYQEGEHWRRQGERQQKRKVEVDDNDGGIGSGGASRSVQAAPSNDKRRRRYSNGSSSSLEEGQVPAGRPGHGTSPPLRSVEKDHDGRRGREERSSGGRDRSRETAARRSPSYSDESEGEIVDRKPGGGKGRTPRSVSRSPNRSPSRSRSRSRGRDDSYSRSPSRSPNRSRSRSDSRDSR